MTSTPVGRPAARVEVDSVYPRPFLPQLEGLRAVAAIGIVFTHVAFQTGIDPAGFVGGILARFDFFVAVFFALSAFLLWRRRSKNDSIRSYYVRRIARIVPAYLVCVVAVMLLVPEAFGLSPAQVLAQLTFTQVYVPDGLVGGLTHLWSLCAEVAFYLVLPVAVLTIARFPTPTWRICCLIAVAGVSLIWPWLPGVAGVPGDGEVNRQIWPMAYTSWFVVGMIAAELEGRIGSRWQVLLRCRPVFWLLALAAAWLAAQEFFGPLGLTHPSPAAFNRRILAGAFFALAVVWPYALAPRDNDLLARPFFGTLGRWSYSIFLWHVAILAVVFPLAGITAFSGSYGDFAIVAVLTIAVSLAVSAASYEFIEVPAARWINQVLRPRGSHHRREDHERQGR